MRNKRQTPQEVEKKMAVFDIKIKLDWSEVRQKYSQERFVEFRREANLILLEEMQIAVVIARTILVPIKSGALQNDIGILEINEIEMFVVAGTSGLIRYDDWVEFGTSKMHARPYWTPPAWEAFYRAKERVEALFNKMFG